MNDGGRLNLAVGCLDKSKSMNSENSDFKALDNNFIIVWVVKTIFGIMAGAAAGLAVAQLLFCTRTVAKELLGAILLGTIVGAFVGIAQSSQMRNVVRDPKLWAIASIAGWAIAAFLFEVNWSISGCMTSSNAPSYIPGNLIKAIHSPIFVIAEQMERMIEGKTIYGAIYNTVTVLLMGSLMGVMLGVPQGIGQWLVLRKDMSRSSIMIWLNVLIWATTYFLIGIVIELVNFNRFWTLMLLPIVLIQPGVVTALALVWLRKKQIGDRPT